ncbi:MAG: 6-hydroxymethylpterin diphosphokinase MptE-like protein [Thermodesulfobacteriota bacterium]
MNKLLSSHHGEKAVILCNGPSLNKVDFKLLEHANVFTFGLNKINLLFDKNTFRPATIVAVNPFVIEQNAEFYNNTNIPLFLNYPGTNWVKLRDNVIFLHSARGSTRQFARNCSISINQGYTVTYVAMQLAFHMGFQQVALVGCDHSFTSKGPANKTVTAGATDPNHFHPKYFADGVEWQLPDLAGSEIHYETARDIYEQFDREIVNCTDGGKLEVFPRKSLKDFLES